MLCRDFFLFDGVIIIRHGGFVHRHQDNAQNAGQLQGGGIYAQFGGGIHAVDDDAVELAFHKTAGVVQQQGQAEGQDIAQRIQGAAAGEVCRLLLIGPAICGGGYGKIHRT